MGDLQVPPADDLLAEKENVDVDVARPLGDVPRPAQRGLDLEAGGQQRCRGLAGLDLTNQIQKKALVHNSHGFGLVHRRAENRFHSPFVQTVQGASQVVFPVAQIGPE